jgi:cytochrome P450
VRFDPFTPGALADPYPQYAELRAADPVHWSEKLQSWVLTRYDDVTAAFRDDVRFSANRARAARAPASTMQPPQGLRTVSSDPPECVVPRATLLASLLPRVRALAPRVETVVDGLLARLAARAGSEIDLVGDFAYPLPITIIAELLDVPEDERPRFQERSRVIARGMDRFYGSDDVSTGLRDLGAYFMGLVLERKDTGGADLVRGLLGAAYQGDRLGELEVVAMCTALVFAGHETTSNLIGNGMLALLQRPRELERLRDDPSVASPAVEELLRFDSPAQFISRVVGEDVELRGKRLRAGDSVLLGIGAANRDPAVFADPDRLDVGRAPNPHIAFGLGTHVCPGAHLTRLEARIALRALLRRFPAIRCGTAASERRTTFILRGLDRLPVRLG